MEAESRPAGPAEPVVVRWADLPLVDGGRPVVARWAELPEVEVEVEAGGGTGGGTEAGGETEAGGGIEAETETEAGGETEAGPVAYEQRPAGVPAAAATSSDADEQPAVPVVEVRPSPTTGGRRRRVRVVAAVAAAAVLVPALAAAAVLRGPSDPKVVVGYTGETLSTPPTAPATVLTEPPSTLPPPDLGRPPLPEPAPAVGLKVANGKPYAPAIEFRSDIAVPEDLVFVLVIGSDARPKEDLLATRADSIHLLALNPRTMQGTIVGFPRDSYVQYPRGGRGKINDALSRGGPLYVVETVRALTGLPIQYYVLTGFVGLQRMVDEVGGVDVFVDRRMNDAFSGARFEKGWQHLVGGEALAFSRNRHDVANGDFTRSEHQGQLLLAGLGKLRSTVADDGGLLMAMDLLRRTCKLDVPLDQLPRLAALARRLDPARLSNVVLPGRVGTAGGASVVYLTQDAPRLFADLRDDAVIGTAAGLPGAAVPPTPSTSTTTTSTTAAIEPPPTNGPATTTTTSTPVPTTTTDAPPGTVLAPPSP